MKTSTFTLRIATIISMFSLVFATAFGQYREGDLRVDLDYLNQEMVIKYTAASKDLLLQNGQLTAHLANNVRFSIVGYKTDYAPYKIDSIFEGAFLKNGKDTTYVYHLRLPSYSGKIYVNAFEFNKDWDEFGETINRESIDIPIRLNIQSDDQKFSFSADLEPNSLFEKEQTHSRNKCYEKIFVFPGDASNQNIVGTTYSPAYFVTAPKDTGGYASIYFNENFDEVKYYNFYSPNVVMKSGKAHNAQFPNQYGVSIPIPKELNFDPTYNHSTPMVVKFYRNGEAIYTVVIPFLVVGEIVKWTGNTALGAPSLHTVLHHAPGDGSYTFMEKSKKICVEETYEVLQSDGVFGSASVSVNASVPLPVPMSFEAEVGIEGGTENTEGNGNSISRCVETIERFTTENSPPGRDGDLYIGTTSTYSYGPSVKIEHDLTKVKVFRTLALNVVQVENFQQTGDQIKETIKKIEDSLAILTSIPDKQKMINDIEAWKYMLKSNEEYVDSVLPKNSTFKQLSNPHEQIKKSEYSDSYSSSSEIFVESGAFTNVGFSFGPVGVNASASFTVTSTVNRSTSQDETVTTEVGYRLYDENHEDEFYIFEAMDKRFGTPIWVLDEKKSWTSCPFEGGNQIDQPELYANIEGKKVTDTLFIQATAGSPQRVNLKFRNNSIEQRTYTLKAIGAAAGLKIGNTVLGDNEKDDIAIDSESYYTMQDTTLIVKENEDLLQKVYTFSLVLFPECDRDKIGDTLFCRISFEDLEVSPRDTIIPSKEGEINFPVESNTEWVVNARANWLRVVGSTSGVKDGIFTIKYDANTSFDSRTAEIRVTTPGGITRNILVTQVESQPYLVVRPVDNNGNSIVSANSRSHQFTVESNVSWSVADNADWLEILDSDQTDTTFIVSYDPNYSESPKVAEIVVKNDHFNIRRKITFVQNKRCFIEEAEAEVSACNDNGTPDNPQDDYYSYYLKAYGQATGDMYNVYDTSGVLIKDSIPYWVNTFIDSVPVGVEVGTIVIRDILSKEDCQFYVYVPMPECVDQQPNPVILTGSTADYEITALEEYIDPFMAGETYSFYTKVTNIGEAGFFSTTSASLWLSADTMIDAGDSLLAEYQVDALDVNLEVYIDFIGTIPVDAEAGDYYLIYQADATDMIEESNEYNNIVLVTAQVQKPVDEDIADYQVTGISNAPDSIYAGERFRMRARISNLGNANVEFKTKAYYWLSTDSTLVENDTTFGADVYLTEDNIDALAAGASNDEYETVEIPDHMPAGTYYLIYQADATHMVNEADESNNQAIRKMYVSRQDSRARSSNNNRMTTHEDLSPEIIVSSTQLAQNYPNPVVDYTVIPVQISQDVKEARIQITGLDGRIAKVIQIEARGANETKINTSDLSEGVWLYSLIADNQLIDTKRMMVGKM